MSEYEHTVPAYPGQMLVAEDEESIVFQSPPRYRTARRVMFWSGLALALLFAAILPSVIPHITLWEKAAGLMVCATIFGYPWVMWMGEYTLRLDLRRGQYHLTRGVHPLRRTMTGSLGDVSHLYTLQDVTRVPDNIVTGPIRLLTTYTVWLVWRRRWAAPMRWNMALANSEFREEGLGLCVRLAGRLGVPDRGLRDLRRDYGPG